MDLTLWETTYTIIAPIGVVITMIVNLPKLKARVSTFIKSKLSEQIVTVVDEHMLVIEQELDSKHDEEYLAAYTKALAEARGSFTKIINDTLAEYKVSNKKDLETAKLELAAKFSRQIKDSLDNKEEHRLDRAKHYDYKFTELKELVEKFIAKMLSFEDKMSSADKDTAVKLASLDERDKARESMLATLKKQIENQ